MVIFFLLGVDHHETQAYVSALIATLRSRNTLKKKKLFTVVNHAGLFVAY